MTPDQISEYGIAAIAIALFVWFTRGMLGNVLKRQEATTKGEESLQSQLQKQIVDMHSRNKELTDRYHTAMTDAMKLATTHGENIMKAVMEVRREHHESMQRVYQRMEKTEEMLNACEERDKRCNARLDLLESQIGIVSKHPAHITGVAP